MTKDWDSVEVEIRELYSKSNGKITLGEIEKLMIRKNFRASTRAYRMKLKEWGLQKHKARRISAKHIDGADEGSAQPEDAEERDRSATVEPMEVDLDDNMTPRAEPMEPTLAEHCTKRRGWQVVEDYTSAEPTFMGLLHHAPTSSTTIDPWSQASTPADVVMDMLGAILENDPDKLENLVMQHKEHLNDPIGMPFDATGRFSGHPIMDQMVIGQHPGQTLLDVTCGMPCGPSLWVLISHGAKGSQHPLGSDLAFHNAIKNGRTVNVMVLARPGRSKVNGLPGTAWKPLLQAVYWNHPDIVRILLRRGANLEDAAPSPLSSGYQTPLQLSLERRARDYLQDSVRDNCNNIIRQLLEAGANIHAPPPAGSTATPFAMFMQPWQTVSFWSSKLSVTELDSLRMFVSGGASLQTSFVGCPCGSLKQIFKHQALWHSSPNVARLIVDSVTASTGSSNMSSLLHEVLGSCAESKRHPADTLRDLQVLLQRGANPNLAEINEVTPLRKCIERCPAVDLIARLKLLLDAGADPEDEDRDGIQPFVLAARTLEEPILSDVMQAMVGNMRGRYRRVIGGVVRTWSVKHFPISDTQNYEQVMSCTRNTGDFRLEMLDMVPEDIRDTFQRAYFTVVSRNFLDTMARTAKSRMLTARDKDEIVWIIGMRRGIDLPEYRFDQELVIALLDPQTMSSMQANSVNLATSSESTRMTTETAQSLSNSIPTIDDAADESTPRATWQFNPNNPITTPPRANANETLSPESLDEDYIIPSTTLIRWRNPEAQPKPGDLEKACASVLRYECATCNDGVPLTKKEQERHEREHAHTSVCEEPYCARRFCALKNGKHINLGCQDHIFAAEGTNVSYHPMSI